MLLAIIFRRWSITHFFILRSVLGEAPDNALSFDEMLSDAVAGGEGEIFDNVNYTVFGTGNKQWGQTYQKIPNKIDATLTTLGGHRFFKKGEGVSGA